MNAAVLTYGALVAAIVCEVIATSFLQQSQQFTRLLPTVLMALFYGAAFYLLSFTLRALPVGVAYAIWSGLGIVLISGIERTVERRHVLLLNFPPECASVRTFEDVGRLKRATGGLVVAPHPFYPTISALGTLLEHFTAGMEPGYARAVTRVETHMMCLRTRMEQVRDRLA